MNPIPVNFVVEDELGAAVLQKLLDQSERQYVVGATYGESGIGYVKTRLKAFNQAARSMTYLVLVDLDRAECAPALIGQWFGKI